MNLARKCVTLFVPTSASFYPQIFSSSQFLSSKSLVSGSCRHFRAAVVKEFGKPLVIEEQKRIKLKKDQIRLRVYCCGINTLDFHNANGTNDPRPSLPFVPGFEVITCTVDINKN